MLRFLLIFTVLSVQIVFCQNIVLNEIMASNQITLTDEDGDYPDWIELYNTGPESIDLSGYGLSDDTLNTQKWIIDSVTINPSEYLVIFASDKDRYGDYLHANFKISASGEQIMLSDTSGTILDQVNLPTQISDISYARISDGSLPWILQEPTPGVTNTGINFEGFADTVSVSQPAGFYSTSVSLELSAGDSRIFYTLDGNDPDTNSTEYSTAINITQTSVLKAISVKENYLPGPMVHHTYFIDEDTDLPVISLSSDYYNLFDPDSGIYPNFTMDWERPAHVEFFEDDKSPGFSENCGIEIYGSQSANWDQKSIAVKFKNDYGVSEIEYPLFPDFELTTFKGFVLRNAGNDWQYTHIRDAIMQILVKDLDIDYLEYRPATSFINGEYWGIYNIREKINEHYIANRHGVDPDNIDMLENNKEVIHGDSLGYQQLIDFISSNDMTTETAYAYVDSAIDLDECILYFAAQAYYDNMDWPATNIKFWRERSPSGKWRWILFGTEFGFGLYGHGEWEDHIAFMFAPTETRYTQKPWPTLLQRKLVENPIIRNRFINQVADLLNTNFKSERVVEVINTLADHISSEISRHRNRWGLSGENIEEKLIPFAENRPAYLRDHVRDFFDCGEDGFLTINATTGGSIKLNTLRLEGDEMPWDGTYFQDNVVHVRAISKVGYKFDGWSGSVSSGAGALELNIGEETNLTATFSIDTTNSSGIVINEINYNSSDLFDSGDWIELYNNSTEPIDLSNWIFTDSGIGHSFIIPDSTIIESEQYLVLVENDTAFTDRFPAVNNYIGKMGFGLSGSGEFIKLTDDAGQIIDSLTYDDTAPWPTAPDGNGPTLELMNPSSDNSKGENWVASAGHGSPGKENSVIISIKEKKNETLPTAFVLEQNHPNPFNPTTTISYSIGAHHDVPLQYIDLSIYNILGQKVVTLVSKKQPAGNYSVEWNARGFSSGIYIYQLKSDKGFQAVKKLVLLK
ncbi:MAG: CotH kinase family protein [Calditrichaceae bacterium]